jgi:ATP-binding cassette subfamily F protein 3
MLLRAEGVSKSFGPKDALTSVSLKMDRGDRIGLIGRNGVGKTTLLKIMMGQIKPDTGDISLKTDKIGYLSQSPVIEPDMKVGAVVGRPYGRLAAVAKRINELEELIASDPSLSDKQNNDTQNEVLLEYVNLQEEYGGAGGFGIGSKARSALAKVGLDKGIIDRAVAKLSGGEITKVFLARVLVQAEDADLIFLDEPTSHLDMETIEWLENYLSKINAGIVVVSHDRYFLDKMITKVVELEDGMANHYSGNYSAFIEKKATELKRKQRAFKKYRNEAERQEKIAELQQQRWTYFSIHKTRNKMVDRLEKVEAPKEEKELKIRIEAADKSGKNVLIASGLSVDRGEQNIFKDINLDIEVGDKLGIFGPNGSGKTTLIKTLLSEISHDSRGNLWLAPGALIGYFGQGHDTLDNSLSPEKQLMNAMGKNEQLKARNLLGRFLISGKDAGRPIATLSGGERARVALALLIAERRNFLIMDEPTNYLDIPSRHAVENALIEYPGTFIIVTHDRYFLDAVCNKVGELKDRKLKIFGGTYSEMKNAKGRHKKDNGSDKYIVVSGFKDWTTGKKYKAGETFAITNDQKKHFSWAFSAGKLKRKSS